MLPDRSLFSIFSSYARLEILFLLGNQPYSLSELTKTLGSISKSEVSRHLARLGEQGLVEKEAFSGKDYTLTSFGETVTSLITPIGFLSENDAFFRDHSLSDLPAELLFKIDALKSAKMVNGASKVVVALKECLDSAKEELWAMYNAALPFRNSKIHKARLIVRPDYYSNEILTGKHKEQFDNLRRESTAFRLLPVIKVGIAIFDRGESAIISFPRVKENITDMTTIFVVEERVGMKYVKNTWKYFWNLAKPA
ncbi:MAG: ArsR family transcriptional regulator [Candidatus Odinarchaeota archaeon]